MNSNAEISEQDKINFIITNVDKLNIENKKTILRYICRSDIPSKKIHVKQNGTQIRFDDMNSSIIDGIYQHVTSFLNEKLHEIKLKTDIGNEI